VLAAHHQQSFLRCWQRIGKSSTDPRVSAQSENVRFVQSRNVLFHEVQEDR
jgi:hypothetical protein